MIPLCTGIIRWCPAYGPFGINPYKSTCCKSRMGERWAMKILIALTGTALMFAVTVVASQSAGTGEPRGELLYSTYCIGCHTTQVHWREKRLATDWTSLKLQIYRWQQNVAPGLGQDDADAIARYLNGLYYHFPATDTKQSDAADESRRVTSRRQERLQPQAKLSPPAGRTWSGASLDIVISE